MVHCSQTHPDRPVSVRDDLATFNAIVPLQELGGTGGGIVPVAFVRPDAGPIMDITELKAYMAGRGGIIVPSTVSLSGSGGRVGAGNGGGSSRLSSAVGKRPAYSGAESRPAKIVKPDSDLPLDLSVSLSI